MKQQYFHLKATDLILAVEAFVKYRYRLKIETARRKSAPLIADDGRFLPLVRRHLPLFVPASGQIAP
jgi:hypothetical protein